MPKKRILKLDAEEKNFLDSFEKGEWNSVRTLKKEKSQAKEAARNFMLKDARINIRMSSYDLDLIKRIAANEGLSYQSLIASVLHKFAASSL